MIVFRIRDIAIIAIVSIIFIIILLTNGGGV